MMEVVELEGLAQSEHVFGAVVPVERGLDCFHRRLAPSIPEFGKCAGVPLPIDDRADDAHAGQTRDVSDNVVQLHVHEHQRLLHVLKVRRGIVHDALAVAKQRSKARDAVARPEAASKESVLVKLL